MPLTLLLGGARSGKSRLAVQLAEAQQAPVVYLATGEPRDEEMQARIELHRAERPGGWETVEEPLELAPAIRGAAADACVVVDCLSLWVSNALEQRPAEEVEALGAAAAEAAASRAGLTIAVSNEVGLGIVPMHPVGRAYRDLLGRVNVLWSEAADDAYFVIAGRALPLERLGG
ncbi:MAG TPA: bifunctional adenosylcobinamide kinase/adenosylcobinamide-phosphate guanylyltransferase [Gaiellaceae bacterium]|jgi:adenosyl cobinamide kinase/adenosyl cobinamide phosphate guanylyltransferase